ncbi:hypothetical protein QLX08_010485 [Tetragonisca angustula]|uniref:Uncharacterized protein n=1 Tax=Tetragonisca angustula TaxID=166442 RepID=A0AAW0ZC33_9HYME
MTFTMIQLDRRISPVSPVIVSMLVLYYFQRTVSPNELSKEARRKRVESRRRVLPGYQVDSESESPGRVHLRGCKPQGSVGDRHRRAAASVRVFA